MNNLNKHFSNRNYFIVFTIMVLIIIGLVFFLQIKIKTSISTILEVDSDKNFSIIMNTANLTQTNESKKIVLLLEGKYYKLENLEFVYLGNNRYSLIFSNDDLFKTVKNNSLYNVNIILGSKTLLDTIFNI